MTLSRFSILRSKRTGGPLRVNTSDVAFSDLPTACSAAEQAHKLEWDDHFSPATGFRTGRVVPRRPNGYLTLVVAHPADASRDEIIANWHHASRYAVALGAAVLEARIEALRPTQERAS